MNKLQPEEVEAILKPYDWEETSPTEKEWDYYGDEDLVHDDINLRYIARMMDPVAMFRPQVLRSWYGKIKDTLVLVVLGTDEGLNMPSIATGSTEEDLKEQIQEMIWQMVHAILPAELQ